MNLPSSLYHFTPSSSVHESYLTLFWLGAGVGLGASALTSLGLNNLIALSVKVIDPSTLYPSKLSVCCQQST